MTQADVKLNVIKTGRAMLPTAGAPLWTASNEARDILIALRDLPNICLQQRHTQSVCTYRMIQ
jgi:hypothetical protein